MPKTALHFLDNLLFVHVRSEETDGHFGMVEFIGPSGDQPPPHVHHKQDEGFYVIEGEVTLFFPDSEIVLGPGDFMRAPRGVPHTYRVTSEQSARWLVMSIPGGFERFVEEYGEPTTDLALPEHTPPDIERIRVLGEKQGIDLLGPPGLLPKDLPHRD